jgi:hypothetical protein
MLAIALVTLIGGVGMLLILLGRRILERGEPHVAMWIVAILSSGLGWLLLELVGSAVAEAVMLPVQSVYHRFVPQTVRDRLNRNVGGPWLLLGLLVCMLVVAFGLSFWLAN